MIKNISTAFQPWKNKGKHKMQQIISSFLQEENYGRQWDISICKLLKNKESIRFGVRIPNYYLCSYKYLRNHKYYHYISKGMDLMPKQVHALGFYKQK
jgi:hypothetical protein